MTYNGSLFTNGTNGNLVNNNPYFYYAPEPFEEQLKTTEDPRGPFILATFSDPTMPLSDPDSGMHHNLIFRILKRRPI